MILVERKACFHNANAFMSRLRLIYPCRKKSKMSKKCVFAKKSPKGQNKNNDTLLGAPNLT